MIKVLYWKMKDFFSFGWKVKNYIAWKRSIFKNGEWGIVLEDLANMLEQCWSKKVLLRSWNKILFLQILGLYFH